MKAFRIILLLAYGVMLSCSRPHGADETTNDDMDSIKIARAKEITIQGPSGLLSVYDNGSTGLPVIFLHSFGGSISHWEKQLDYLGENNRVIALDFRGHGKSQLPADSNYTAEALAQDISAVVDSLKLSRFVLVGHSMGGVAAIAYAGVHSERVAGLVLAGTPGKIPTEQSRAIIQSLESEAYQQVMDDYMKQLLTNARPEVDSVVTRDFKSVSRDASIRIIKAMFAFDPLPLKSYKGPVLIISSSRENMQPNSLHNFVPEMDSKTMEGTSHWMQLDKPEEFNKLLDDFLKRINQN
jgi:pimeloyl-ACP methyl ester carboxylesterase